MKELFGKRKQHSYQFSDNSRILGDEQPPPKSFCEEGGPGSTGTGAMHKSYLYCCVSKHLAHLVTSQHPLSVRWLVRVDTKIHYACTGEVLSVTPGLSL